VRARWRAAIVVAAAAIAAAGCGRAGGGSGAATAPGSGTATAAGAGSAIGSGFRSGSSTDAGPPLDAGAAIDATAARDARPAASDAAATAARDARPAASDAASTAPDDWVDVAAAIPDAVLDLRYAGAHNLTGHALYPAARCLLRRAVAARLARAAATLRAAHRRLVLWDCYRPQSVQLVLWRHLPDPSHVARPRTAADGTPLSGSDHSRGAAVDVSLADAGGAPLAMPTDHDDPGPAARRARARATSPDARLLDDAMRAAGFRPLASEWWHFAAPDAARYPLSDRPVGAP